MYRNERRARIENEAFCNQKRKNYKVNHYSMMALEAKKVFETKQSLTTLKLLILRPMFVMTFPPRFGECYLFFSIHPVYLK